MTDEGSESIPVSGGRGYYPSPRGDRNGQEDSISDGPVDAGRFVGRDRSSGEPHRGELEPFLIDRIRHLSNESRWAEVAPLLEQLGSPPEAIIEAHLMGNCPAEAVSYVERLVTAQENDDGVDAVISVLSALLITPSYGDFDAGGN